MIVKGKKTNMFSARNLLLVTVVLTLLATPIIAASGKATYQVTRTMVVAGTELQPGEYEVKWESKSPEADVTFKLNGKVVAKVQGKIETLETKPMYNTLLIGKDSSGREAIQGLLFGDKNVKVVFE
jgi:hypothetical protein